MLELVSEKNLVISYKLGISASHNCLGSSAVNNTLLRGVSNSLGGKYSCQVLNQLKGGLR